MDLLSLAAMLAAFCIGIAALAFQHISAVRLSVRLSGPLASERWCVRQWVWPLVRAHWEEREQREKIATWRWTWVQRQGWLEDAHRSEWEFHGFDWDEVKWNELNCNPRPFIPLPFGPQTRAPSQVWPYSPHATRLGAELWTERERMPSIRVSLRRTRKKEDSNRLF